MSEEHPAPMFVAALPASRIGKIVLFVTGLLVFTLVVARAAVMPLVHDEAASLFWYVDRAEFLPYRSLWDANNHYLSSAIGILSTKLFGLHLWSIRLFSVIAFVIYAWAIARIVQNIDRHLVRWCTWFALILCPFVIDFFSLFRGYGPMLAFWMLAIERLVVFDRERSARSLAQVCICIGLANASVLSVLPASVILLVVVFLAQIGRTGIRTRFRIGKMWPLMIGAAVVLVGSVLSWELSRRGLLYHGSTEGLIDVTIRPLVRLLFGTDLSVVTWLIISIGVAAGISALRSSSWLRRTIAIVFIGDLLLRIPMALLLDVNYPEDRAAIHLVPIFILLTGWMIDRLHKTAGKLEFAALLLTILPISTISQFKFTQTFLWPEQSVPVEWLQEIAAENEHLNRPLILGNYHQLSLSVPYMARIYGIDLPLAETDDFPNVPTDIKILDDRFNEALGDQRILDENDRLVLTRSILTLTPIAEYRPEISRQEAITVLLNTEELVAAKGGFVEVECVLDCGEKLADIQFVILHRSEPVPKYEFARTPRLVKPYWHGETFKMMKWVSPELVEPRLVLWDPRGVGCKMTDLVIRIHRLDAAPRR
jgi:hypothetical protein